MKTEKDLGCCESPTILRVDPTGNPGECTGKCACCNVRWTFFDCTLDPQDGKVIAARAARPRTNGDILHPPSAGKEIR